MKMNMDVAGTRSMVLEWPQEIEIASRRFSPCASTTFVRVSTLMLGVSRIWSTRYWDMVAVSGRRRYRGYLPYYVAKRAVTALGEALALELASQDTRVHVVAPGPILPVAGSTAADQA